MGTPWQGYFLRGYENPKMKMQKMPRAEEG